MKPYMFQIHEIWGAETCSYRNRRKKILNNSVEYFSETSLPPKTLSEIYSLNFSSPSYRMSFARSRMGNLFGKSSSKKANTTRVTEQDKVVLQMKQQRDKLKQYRRQLENRLEKEHQVAARLVRENKRERALIILRKRKHMEKLIQNVGKSRVLDLKFSLESSSARIESRFCKFLVDRFRAELIRLFHPEGHIEKIEGLTQDVEWTQIEVNVVRNLEKGNEALKSLNALLNIEDIEKMLDETREAAEKQKEVSDLMIGFAGEIEVS